MPSAYAKYIGALDPVDVLDTSLDDYVHLRSRLNGAVWDQSWAPGKWTTRQVMVHVAQWEMILGIRVRCGVAAPDYEVQAIDQDEIMRLEGNVVDGPTAWAAFEGARRMNLAFARSLSPAERRRMFKHPEHGEIDVEYLLVTLAGHSVHHFRQIAPLAGVKGAV